MKKFSSAIIIAVMLIFTLLGCSEKKSKYSSREEIKDIAASLSDDLKEDSDFDKVESISASIKDDKGIYTYDGDNVNIEYQYSAVGSKSVGIMILCNGFAVPFSTDTIVDRNLLQIIPNNSNGETLDITLNFVPYGESGDNVSIEIVDIVEPDFDIGILDLNQPLTSLIHGRKYLVNYISGITVTMNKDGIENQNQVYKLFETKEFSEEEIENNKTINEDGTVTNQLKFFKSNWSINNEKSLAYIVKQGDVLDISVEYSGTPGQNVITSFYIDNNIFPAFDSICYSESFVDDKHSTTINGKIDTSDLEKGKHICYSVCGNIENSVTIPTAAFIIEVK